LVRFSESKHSGIVYAEKYDHINIAVEHYFRDFKTGVVRYYDKIKSGDEILVSNFSRATRK
jgi:hypothetical protein